MLGSLYGTQTYAVLEKKSQVKSRYEEKYVAVMAESLRRCALELSSSATDSTRPRHKVWVV